MKTIIVTCDGSTPTIETKGFAGKACLAETADLERALGVKTRDTPTPEARLTATTDRKIVGRQ